MSPPGWAHPYPTIFPRERLDSYLRRVSMMSCGRDMWCQCPSHGLAPYLHPCCSAPYMVRNCPCSLTCSHPIPPTGILHGLHQLPSLMS